MSTPQIARAQSVALRNNAIGRLRKRKGNPNWGKPDIGVPDRPTAFELEVARLGLTPEQYVGSFALKRWVNIHKGTLYVPEDLLKAWGMSEWDCEV